MLIVIIECIVRLDLFDFFKNDCVPIFYYNKLYCCLICKFFSMCTIICVMFCIGL